MTNKINNKCYVGQTIRPPHIRWGQHKASAKRNQAPSGALHRAIRKYGINAFEFEVMIDGVPMDLLDDMETGAIAMEDAFINGYNILEYGRNSIGLKHSKETKAKLAKIRTGAKHLEESKAKISAAGTGGLNPRARVANIYCYKTNKIIASDVCIAEWCKGKDYTHRSLSRTAYTRERKDYKYPRQQHKGLYAVYTDIPEEA